jgi:multiple sugar transport system ATP-binding protein
MATVEISQLTKRYTDTRGTQQVAVKGIDLSIAAGEFMVLVGPSGCGKSTTLRMIAGLEGISSGSIRIEGQVINELPARERDIAMVFQNYALYPHMSVYDNLAFGLKMRKTPPLEIRSRVDEAAAMLGLSDLLGRRPNQLSGGQRQRVAVGRAIVRKPKVFLFDEPLSNLDAKMRVSMRAELSALHKRLGATMIYVTHDQVEAMTLGNRICVMNAGAIQQVARPLDLYAWPENVFTATFVGSPPMNLLAARLEISAGGVLARTTAGAPLRLAENLRLRSAATNGAEIQVGFRPEDIALGHNAISGRVVLTENLGAETHVHAEIGTERCILRLAPSLLPTLRDVVNFQPDPSRIRIFDTATGASLLDPSPSGLNEASDSP